MPEGSLHYIPYLPDPSKHFMVDVDASETDVGLILPQHFSKRPKLHPMRLYSKKLSPTERNYDISNPEPLAVKLVGGVPLENCQVTESMSAPLGPILCHFSFMLCYQPGSKTTKADSLSIHYPSEQSKPSHDSIVSPSSFVKSHT